jgi:lysophospholipase L1-like esterase
MANAECMQAACMLVAERQALHGRDAGRERSILCFGDSNTWGYAPGETGASRATSAGPARFSASWARATT